MISVLNIIGTRPEAIKMAPVILELQKFSDIIKPIVCVTGQHRDMVNNILQLFNIKADYNLDVMTPNQTLATLSSELLRKLDNVVKKESPDWILAQGDTTSVLISAMIAYYNKIHFGHIEAGLRTGSKYSPFPEEINRKLADQIADIHFAPTENNRTTLISESIDPDTIIVTGNTVTDAIRIVSSIPYSWDNGPLASIPQERRIVLITAHRRESFGKAFQEICTSIKELATKYNDVNFVYPVHLNPNVQKPVFDLLSGTPNIKLIPPIDYVSMVNLMKKTELILTDSGGIQEEATGLQIPTLIMRDTTERQEAISNGSAKLIGTSKKNIINETTSLLNRTASLWSTSSNPFGDGHAARLICQSLLEFD